MFPADREPLFRKLEGTGLVPALQLGGRFMVALGLVKYTDSNLGAYNEVILAIPSLPAGTKAPWSNWADLVGPLHRRRVGQYILHIPVTSRFSMLAGRELWGYPKIVAPITHQHKGHSLQVAVEDPVTGEQILSLGGNWRMSIPFIPLPLITYSFQNNMLLRTEVAVRGTMQLRLWHNLRLQVGPSQHPFAADLRDLGLHNRQPWVVLDTPHFQSVFYPGKPMGQ